MGWVNTYLKKHGVYQGKILSFKRKKEKKNMEINQIYIKYNMFLCKFLYKLTFVLFLFFFFFFFLTVLSDKHTRTIYDIYGEKGLECGMEVSIYTLF